MGGGQKDQPQAAVPADTSKTQAKDEATSPDKKDAAPVAAAEGQKKLTREELEKQKKKDEPEQLDIEMKPGDYRIQVHIMEAKDIKAKGKAGGGGFLAKFEGETADPMVEVEVLNQTKVTDYKSGQLCPIFNELLFFEFQGLKTDDLETGMIKISLLDHDFIGSNNMIGQFTVDLSYIYKMNKDHELYKMWIAMTDISDETQSINGFIKVSINVLGPGDKPPIHDPSKGLQDKNDNGVTKLFTPGRVKLTGHLVKLNIFRAEHLAPLDLMANSVDPYVKVSFAGAKAESRTIQKDRNPEFNQELSIACKLPCMNNKIKIEIWDDDVLNDRRVGTHYLNFKQIQNKTIGPRWANLYGPPLVLDDENEDSQLMTKFGDKGSTYRGRFLYQITSHDQEKPKSGTKDLKFTFPSHPSPNVKEKAYLLKVALYEGMELPDAAESYCVIVSCGPWEICSEMKENNNSRAVWNQYLPDQIIRGPEQPEDIPDIIIYLSTDPKDLRKRICYKRLKAVDLLDTSNRKFEIERFMLQEDLAHDALDDEQFPGFIFARIKLYSRDAEDEFPDDLFKSTEDYTDYLLQIHLYQGKNLPPADESGAADPFIVARCQGKKAKSRTKYETLNPGFFETVEMVVSLPPLGDPSFPQPGISLLVYDEDPGLFGAKKDLLGRIWIDIEKKISQIVSPVDGKKYPVVTHFSPAWQDLIFDATNSKEGQIMIGYDLITMDVKDQFPIDKIDIKPKTIPGSLSMAIIGFRDIISSIDLFPVKKLFCKFDISGDTKEAVITNKHAVIGGACNVFEVITLEIDVPLNLDYSPVLTVYVYDNLMGFLGTRLVGVTNIPLEKYCQKVIQSMNKISKAFNIVDPKQIKLRIVEGTAVAKAIEGDNKLGDMKSLASKSPMDNSQLDVSQISGSQEKKLKTKLMNLRQQQKKKDTEQEVIETDRGLLGAGPTEGDLAAAGTFNLSKEINQELFDQNAPEFKIGEIMKDDLSGMSQLLKSAAVVEPMDKEKMDKKVKEQIKKEMYKKKVLEDQETMKKDKELKELAKAQKLDVVRQRSKINHKLAKFMENQEDYDSQPDEELDQIPEWLDGRITVEDELEDTLCKPPFDVWKILRGQTRGKASRFAKKVQSTMETTALYKNIIKIKDKSQLKAEGDAAFKEYITSKKLYILKGKSLTPKDTNTSDPYLIIRLGNTVITDKESLRPKTCNPSFFRSYDIPATLPGASTLAIEAWDDDGFDFPDLIGTTKIDLEDRYFNKDWRKLYPEKKPIEERTLFIPKSSAPQGVIQCWVEILDPKEAGANPRYDISPPPKQEFELRVIVWGTKDVVFKDEIAKCNDLYLKGILGAKNLETDTHWRCRQKGSFNWRWKFPVTLPLDPDEDYGKDILTIQMWDRDIVASNDMICETQILLNADDFRMFDKAYKRKTKVTMKKMDLKTKKPMDRFWICLTHPEAKDKDDNYIPQGFAEISIEILPKHLADEINNGLGRDGPNQHPILPEPTGRFSFDIFSPWKMIKELIGPSLARKICCIVCCLGCLIFAIYWGFFLVGDIIGAKIAQIGQ